MTIPDGCPIDYMHCILQGMYYYVLVNKTFLFTDYTKLKFLETDPRHLN